VPRRPARAHALNLKDSGHDVVIGARAGGGSFSKAEADGFVVKEPLAAVQGAAIVAILTPDTSQAELIAPKGPGDLVRRQYEEGHGVPCLVAVEQDSSGNALQLALAYAQGIGGARAGVIETTFAEETETDLFGEQAVLCGGATELVVAGFDTLVKAGYQPEVAYYEVMHELKLIVDLLHEGGLRKMHERANMQAVLDDIQDGTFAKRWIEENKAGQPEYKRLMNADLEHPIEKVGADLRSRMDWLEN